MNIKERFFSTTPTKRKIRCTYSKWAITNLKLCRRNDWIMKTNNKRTQKSDVRKFKLFIRSQRFT